MKEPYSTLFLGMPISAEFRSAMSQGKNHLHKHYLGDNYLQEIELHGVTYIGKNADEQVDLPKLISMQEHIYSLLRTITPDFPFKDYPLELIPIRT